MGSLGLVGAAASATEAARVVVAVELGVGSTSMSAPYSLKAAS